MIVAVLLIIAIVYSVGVLTGVYVGSSIQKETSKKSQKTAPSEKDRRKILTLFETKQKITNNDVEKLLKVSDATSERYLNRLEKTGDITQKGKTGRSVFYTKTEV
jgi:predicted HTH transcriptional regulator